MVKKEGATTQDGGRGDGEMGKVVLRWGKDTVRCDARSSPSPMLRNLQSGISVA